MNTLPDFFSSLISQLPKPPEWLVAEGHNRIVLLLNHVLMQEPEAMQRLVRQQGRVVSIAWQQFNIHLTATPVGLLAVAPLAAQDPSSVDLQLEVVDTDLGALGQKIMRGDSPKIRIEGDIQLAAEVQWLTQNVKWDIEGDLARIVGNVPAHHMVKTAKDIVTSLREWLAK
ncbi:MAG: hypothetical protein QM533_07470 [Cytophagales bacterium]|nr:hypothetical protein [Cytophagales bacterium]